MKFSLASVVAFLAAVMATPTYGSDYTPCSGLYSEVECCEVSVLGVLDLNCVEAPSVPYSASDYTAICQALNRSPACCVIPAAGLGVLCTAPPGT